MGGWISIGTADTIRRGFRWTSPDRPICQARAMAVFGDSLQMKLFGLPMVRVDVINRFLLFQPRKVFMR